MEPFSNLFQYERPFILLLCNTQQTAGQQIIQRRALQYFSKTVYITTTEQQAKLNIKEMHSDSANTLSTFH